jgi:hypothetical protein
MRDCDHDAAMICETDISKSIEHCGACGNACPQVAHGSKGCKAGNCGVGACLAPHDDCNGSFADGCETDTANHVDHCGGCGKACGSIANGQKSCKNGKCIAACDTGFADCNAKLEDGCETNLMTDPASCGACGKTCKDPACFAGACFKTVFVTSVAYGPNLGGLAGADAKCQTLAKVAGLPGIYKAWLSDGTASAAQRLTHATVPYLLVDGAVVATSWAGLSGNLKVAINRTEKGTVLPPPQDPFDACRVWTNTKVGGAKYYDGSDCGSWSSDIGSAILGNYASTVNWTVTCSGPCTFLAHLYCFEQ